MKRPFLLAALLALFPSCLALPPSEEWFHSRAHRGDRISVDAEAELRIWIPYVGQGDATLVISPNGKTLLIDAGPPGAAQAYLFPLLEKLGIQSLDAFVLTHYDLDHLGGVPELLAGRDGVPGTSDDIQISSAYDRGGEPWESSPGYGKYLGALSEHRVSRRTLAAGDRLLLDPDLSLRCVAANGEVRGEDAVPLAIDLSPPTYAGRENASSIALLIEHGNFRYLTAGDLTGGGQGDGFLTPDVETLLTEAVGQVDALHVNHHGSFSSSNPAFVAATSPRVAFIQAGDPSPYGHPHPAVLEEWSAQGAEVRVTAQGRSFRLSAYPDGRMETSIEGDFD